MFSLLLYVNDIYSWLDSDVSSFSVRFDRSCVEWNWVIRREKVPKLPLPFFLWIQEEKVKEEGFSCEKDVIEMMFSKCQKLSLLCSWHLCGLVFRIVGTSGASPNGFQVESNSSSVAAEVQWVISAKATSGAKSPSFESTAVTRASMS